MDLKKLPSDHPLRNTPLIEIGAQYKRPDSKVWQEVTPPYGIAKKTFNSLTGTWLTDDWKATKFSEDWQTDERDRAVAQNGNVGYE